MSLCKGYGPKCFGNFVSTNKEYEEIVRRYLDKGYDFCLTAASTNNKGIVCGDLTEEYRHLARPALFFKGIPPSWDLLTKGEYGSDSPVVIVEYRKFYSNMSSIGRGLYFGEFDGKDLAEWIAFWENGEATRTSLKSQLCENSDA